MCRFSALMAIMIGLIAPQVQAERVLSRDEVAALVTGHAVCYATEDGACYAAEYFDSLRDDTVDVIYALHEDSALLIVRERATWDGSSICVTSTADEIIKAWDTGFGDKRFHFDLRNANARSPSQMDALRAEFGASRAEGYCYHFTSDSSGLTGLRSHYVFGDEASSAPFRLIPFADLWVDMQ